MGAGRQCAGGQLPSQTERLALAQKVTAVYLYIDTLKFSVHTNSQCMYVCLCSAKLNSMKIKTIWHNVMSKS